MSIYSGFPTRSLESSYNQIISELFALMQSLLLNFIQVHKFQVPVSWSQNFCISFNRMAKLEKQKHLWPNFSDTLKELNSYLHSLQSASAIERYTERKSVPNTSSGSLKKDNFPKTGNANHRYSSLQSARSKERNLLVSAKPEKSERKNKVKSYQDKILKSILQDLSNPLYQFNNF
jgi:hypothetical protein